MDCTETKDWLLEAAEGRLAVAEAQALDRHLARCEACRAELGALRRAVEALRAAIPELAPQETYLTAERLNGLMEGHGRHTRIFRLVSYRQFVAAAAVAAIVVSTAFITWNLRQETAPPIDGPSIVAGPLPSPYVPVVMATTGHGDPTSVVGSLPASIGVRPIPQRTDPPLRLVRTDSPGLIVPVDHVLYDPAESSRWW